MPVGISWGSLEYISPRFASLLRTELSEPEREARGSFSEEYPHSVLASLIRTSRPNGVIHSIQRGPLTVFIDGLREALPTTHGEIRFIDRLTALAELSDLAAAQGWSIAGEIDDDVRDAIDELDSPQLLLPYFAWELAHALRIAGAVEGFYVVI